MKKRLLRSVFAVALAVAMLCASMQVQALYTSDLDALEKESDAVQQEVASEGIVMLENNGTAPFEAGTKFSVYGRTQIDWITGGAGSGGINQRNNGSIDLIEALDADGTFSYNKDLLDIYQKFVDENPATRSDAGTITASTNYPEMPLENVDVAKYADEDDAAIIVIGRYCGEGNDINGVDDGLEYANTPQAEGSSYYMLDSEMDMIDEVTSNYDKVAIIFNIGNIIDLSWLGEYAEDGRIDSAYIVWQTGGKGAYAIPEVLSGEVNPSGKLTTTFANAYEDYPTSMNMGSWTKSYYWNYAAGWKGETDSSWGASSPFGGGTAPTAKSVTEYQEGIYVGYRFFETFDIDVAYEFGYGLSYTDFDINIDSVTAQKDRFGNFQGDVNVQVTVTNTGNYAGKEVVQVYYSAPDGELDKPAKELAAYQKTDLLAPGESQTLTISYEVNDMASYSEDRAAYILDAGDYKVLVGNSVKNVVEGGVVTVNTLTVTEQLSNQLEIEYDINELTSYAEDPFEVLDSPDYSEEAAEIYADLIAEGVPTENPVGEDNDYINTIINNYGSSYAAELEWLADIAEEAGEAEYKLVDVYNGKVSMEDFLAQATIEELAAMLVGSNDSGRTTSTVAIERLGIPEGYFNDGPAGVNKTYNGGASAYPIALLQACTWNTELIQKMGDIIGREMEIVQNSSSPDGTGIDVLLGPVIEIIRNPLGGRNYETYSEDPLVCGTMGAAYVNGIQTNNDSTVCMKHFGCNNQETNRSGYDAVVSERALREVYLKAYQIVVENSDLGGIMTSYNFVNGEHSAENIDLTLHILRDEWGFDGFLVSDWSSGSFNVAGTAKYVLADNNLIMPGNPRYVYRILSAYYNGLLDADTPVTEDLQEGDATGREAMERNAGEVLKTLMKDSSYKKYFAEQNVNTVSYSPESAQENSEFTITVVTDMNQANVKLVNEKGNSVTIKKASVDVNEDLGIKTWTLTTAVATVGSRNLTVLFKERGGSFEDIGASFNIEITADPNCLASVKSAELSKSTVKVNKEFTATIVTNDATRKIGIVNENDINIGKKLITKTANSDGTITWVYSLKLGTARSLAQLSVSVTDKNGTVDWYNNTLFITVEA